MEWDPAGAASSDQMSLMEMAFQPADEKAPKMSEEVQSLVQDLRELSVQELTPLEALNRIAQWQRHLS
jgi:hypothetical protein